MRLIGINGFKTAGKDSTYQAIKAVQGDRLSVERAGFADKLKVMAAKALGYEGSDVELIEYMDEAKQSWRFGITDEADGEPIKQFSGREYLQWFGGHARVVFWDSFWVDQILPTPAIQWTEDINEQENCLSLLTRYPDVDILCVTDVRYENEAARVLQLGGEMWVVERPGLESDGHSSEIPLPDDLVTKRVPNDGSLLDLQETVRTLL